MTESDYIKTLTEHYVKLGHSEAHARVFATAQYAEDCEIFRILDTVVNAETQSDEHWFGAHPVSPPYDGSQRQRRYWKKVQFQ